MGLALNDFLLHVGLRFHRHDPFPPAAADTPLLNEPIEGTPGKWRRAVPARP